MKRIYYSAGCKQELARLCPLGAVYALGFFDGVHIAHRALLREAKSVAKNLDLPLGVFTFSSESKGIKPGSGRIYSTEDKLDILEELSVDFTVICDFEDFKELSPESFVMLLCEELRIKCGVFGFNFRFGKGAQGDSAKLSRLLSDRAVPSRIIDQISLEDSVVSASRIRELIENKNPYAAARLLGLPYFVSSEVIHGRGEGRNFGFPTINTDFKEGALIPHDGVYLTAVKIKDKIYSSITNVGKCPTFSCEKRHAETYIINFEGNLYGKTVKIHFVEYLRDEKIFDSSDELTRQLSEDCQRAIALSSEELWQKIGLK